MKNNQMRAIARFLEDHGVNMVFNGHEHNYQRSLPLRANSNVADGPSPSGPSAVSIDTSFDGVSQTVPDGVLYFVEGAGDGSVSTFMFPNGPASWLDTNLTDNEMSPVLPGAGSGPKITARFKAKVFSFADILVRGNQLQFYQISEPLLSTSSATPGNPAPFGTDFQGNPLKDPIPDTLVDPATGNVVSPPADGPSVLLDRFVVTKPDLEDRVSADLEAPRSVGPGSQFTYVLHIRNDSSDNLNGTQAVFRRPPGVSLVSSPDGGFTTPGDQVVVTLGRLVAGGAANVGLMVSVDPGADSHDSLGASALVRSSTALPSGISRARTQIRGHGGGHDFGDDEDGDR